MTRQINVSPLAYEKCCNNLWGRWCRSLGCSAERRALPDSGRRERPAPPRDSGRPWTLSTESPHSQSMATEGGGNRKKSSLPNRHLTCLLQDAFDVCTSVRDSYLGVRAENRHKLSQIPLRSTQSTHRLRGRDSTQCVSIFICYIQHTPPFLWQKSAKRTTNRLLES